MAKVSKWKGHLIRVRWNPPPTPLTMGDSLGYEPVKKPSVSWVRPAESVPVGVGVKRRRFLRSLTNVGTRSAFRKGSPRIHRAFQVGFHDIRRSVGGFHGFCLLPEEPLRDNYKQQNAYSAAFQLELARLIDDDGSLLSKIKMMKYELCSSVSVPKGIACVRLSMSTYKLLQAEEQNKAEKIGQIKKMLDKFGLDDLMTKLTELVLLEGGRELVTKVVTMLKFLQADGWRATLESVHDKFSLAEDRKNEKKLRNTLLTLFDVHSRLVQLEAKLEGKKLLPKAGDSGMPVKKGEDEEKPTEDADEGESSWFISFLDWLKNLF